jgi:hypothetical protein
MKTILVPLLTTLADLLRSRVSLHLEMLALRQQLAMVASRDNKRLRFRPNERIFWVWLYRLWPSCLQTLAIFKPDTLVRWHRKGFRLYWTWKSRRYRGGRPAIDPEVRELIRTMSRNNIGWGAPRIHGELEMFGFGVSQIRRECLNHVIIFNERHLRKVLKSYAKYYHEARTHLSLDKQSPVPRSIETPHQGKVVAIPHVGGFHHEYRRAA